MAINTIILATTAAGASLRGAYAPSGGLKPCVQNYHYADPGSPEQFDKLNEVAMKAFSASSMERGSATSSVWTGLPKSFGSQEMMCSIVESVFNTVYAVGENTPEYNGTKLVNQLAASSTQSFFQQANRDSCGNSAVAAVLAQANPKLMVSRLSTLYWQGTLTTGMGAVAKYQPRPYSLQLDQQAACKQKGQNWCQKGATFIWTVATRDAWNVEILSTDRYHTPEVQKHSKISAAPVQGDGSQGGSGASYNSATGLLTGLLSMLNTESENNPVKVVQGACSTLATATEQQTCRDGLNGLLPSELTSLKSWFTDHASAIIAAIFSPKQDPSKVPSYNGWSPNVRARVDDDKMLWLKQYYTPVHTSEIQNVCKQQQKSHNSHPVMLAVNDAVVGIPNDLPCTKGLCMANHWVVLETSSCDDTCTVWTWGYTKQIPCAELAEFTTTIVHGF